MIRSLDTAYKTGREGQKTFRTELARATALMNWRLGSSMKIKRIAVNPEKTTYAVNKYGLASLLYRPVAFASNQHNELVALQARVLKTTPTPVPAQMNSFLRWCRRSKKLLFPRSFGHEIVPMEFEEYLKGSNASVAVKNLLRQTRAALAADGINEYTQLTKDQVYKWTKRKSFVKVENNLYRAPGSRLEKAPRLIQGATPEFVCLLGPWFAALQKKVKRDWNINNFITYTSSISNLKLGNKLVNFGGQLAEDDVSAWDTSVSLPLCNFELTMTRDWFKAPKAVVQLVQMNIQTHGATSTGISYRVRGTRKSGDPYTSLYNSILNALMHVWIIARRNTWSVATCSTRIVMYVQGDDNAMSVKGIYPNVTAEMLALGFSSKFLRRTNYVQLEFCSMRIQAVKEGYTFGPKIGRVLSKTGYYINPPQNISRKAIVKGTMLGLVNSSHHLLPLMSYIKTQLRLCGDVVAYTHRKEEWKTVGAKCTPTLQTMADLQQQTMWTYDKQKMLDRDLDRMCNLEDMFDTPLVRMLCDRETAAVGSYF
jgi:hypothetical protein